MYCKREQFGRDILGSQFNCPILNGKISKTSFFNDVLGHVALCSAVRLVAVTRLTDEDNHPLADHTGYK